MPDAPGAPSLAIQLVLAEPHSSPEGAPAGRLGGPRPAHLVLVASPVMASHSRPAQALLHRIMWHETHDAARDALVQ